MKEFEHSGQTIPKGKRFCACCGEIRRETAFEGDSEYCTECCKKMLHTRPRVTGAAVCLLFVCAAVFAAVLIPKGTAVSALVARARALEAQGKLYTACSVYDEAIECAAQGSRALSGNKQDAQQEDDGTQQTASSFLSPGIRIWREAVRANARAFTRTEAADYAAAHLDKKQVDAVQPFASYADASRDYDTVFTQVRSIQSQYTYDSPERMPYDKIAKELDEFAEKRNTPNIRGYTAYFKASAAWFHDPSDPKTPLALYDEMLEYVPDEYVSAYTGIAQIGLESGDSETLLRAAEGILEKNKEHGEAWSWKVQALYDAGDEEAAQKAVDDMRAACPDSPLCGAMALRLALRQEDVEGAAALRDEAVKRYDTQANRIFNTLLAKRSIDDTQTRLELSQNGMLFQINMSPPLQAFPDIAAGEYGIEVKFTKDDTWRTIGNSIQENQRVSTVKYVYLVFGKMGGVPEVRWGEYEACIIHVRTSHVPRFEVEIGLDDGTMHVSLFKQMGIRYEDFCRLEMSEKMKYIRQYAMKLHPDGKLWWLEGLEEHTLPVQVRLYTNLTREEKKQLRAEMTLLYPEIVRSGRSRDKYGKVALFLLTYHGVLCYQVRDLFSAGSVANPNNDDNGGLYVARALKLLEDEMISAAQRLPDSLFEDAWGETVPVGKRIMRWLELADAVAEGWKPSEVLFLDAKKRDIPPK